MNELTKQTVVFQNKEYTIATMTSSKGSFGVAPDSLDNAIHKIIFEVETIGLPKHKDYDEAVRIDKLYDFIVEDKIIDDTHSLVECFFDKYLLDEDE